MKLNIIGLFFVFSFALIVFSSLATACNPSYICPDWGTCEDGIQTRLCQETACGLPANVERRLCSSEQVECKIQSSCSEWSQCSYIDKTEDILTNNIRFKGYQERQCSDSNNCIESFVEQKACEDSFKVKFVKVDHCGSSFLMALDENSNKEVSEINLDSWKQQRLDLAFVQNNFSYCPSCYNGVKDELETGIDCGGDCKNCVDETGVTNQIILISSSWFISLIIFSGFIFSSFFDRKTRVKYLIYRAYRALDSKDKVALLDSVKKIKHHYPKLSPEQKKLFERELDSLYRRV